MRDDDDDPPGIPAAEWHQREREAMERRANEITRMLAADPAPPPSKTCSRCRITKPRAEFYRAAASKDGLTPWCKVCQQVTDKRTRHDPKPHRVLVKV